MKLLAGSSSPMAIMMVVSAGVMWAGSGLGAQNVYEKSSINSFQNDHGRNHPFRDDRLGRKIQKQHESDE